MDPLHIYQLLTTYQGVHITYFTSIWIPTSHTCFCGLCFIKKNPIPKFSDVERADEKTSSPSPYDFQMFGISCGMPVVIVLVVGGLVAVFVSFAAIIVAVHRIKEGNVGVYYKVTWAETHQVFSWRPLFGDFLRLNILT